MRVCLEEEIVGKNKPYREHLKSWKDLVTPYEATRAGFVALALKRSRRSTPFVEQARALKASASQANTPKDLMRISGIQTALLTAAGVSDKATGHMRKGDKEEAVTEFLAGVLEEVEGARFKAPTVDENDYSRLVEIVESSQAEYASIPTRRILSALSLMRTARPQEILSAAQGATGISDGEISAWQEVRHRVMHGNFDEWPGKTDYAAQDKIDATARIATMINKILLYLVHYRGALTDYGQIGYADLCVIGDLNRPGAALSE
jgi:hypothetical protein